MTGTVVGFVRAISIDTGRAICPGCHTVDPTMTTAAIEGGEGWQCPRCAQRWDAERLAAVARYATWVADHDHLDRDSDK
jgi:hypothetical protein